MFIIKKKFITIIIFYITCISAVLYKRDLLYVSLMHALDALNLEYTSIILYNMYLNSTNAYISYYLAILFAL